MSVHDELQRQRERHEQEQESKRSRRTRRIVTALIGLAILAKAEVPYIYGFATGKYHWSWIGLAETVAVCALVFAVAFYFLHKRTRRTLRLNEQGETR